MTPNHRPVRLRSLIAVIMTSLGLASGMIVFSAPAVMAQSKCEKATGGSTSSVSYTGKNSGNSNNGYTCAYQRSQGKITLNPLATKSWTSNTAAGYKRMTTCTQKQDGSISNAPAYATTAFGSSWTQTNTNWSFSKKGYVGSGIFWATDDVAGSQYTTSPCNWGSFPTSLFWITSSALTLAGYNKTSGAPIFGLAVTPEGNAPAGSVAGIFQMQGDTPDPENDRTVAGGPLDETGAFEGPAQVPLPLGTYQFYAVYGGSGADQDPRVSPDKLSPPQRGWLPSLSNVISVKIEKGVDTASSSMLAPRTDVQADSAAEESLPMSVVNASSQYPRLPSARCADGQRPIQVQGYSPKAFIGDEDLVWRPGGARLKVNGLKKGDSLRLQVVCRAASSEPQDLGSLALGTQRSDRITQAREGSVFAGPGGDVVKVTQKKVTAYGALGRDRIVVRAAKSVADGGRGADVLRSTTKDPRKSSGVRAGRSMLIGGPGGDRVIGGRGPDLINVLDGRPNDTVRCRGSRNRVLADKGDTVKGNCRTIRRGA